MTKKYYRSCLLMAVLLLGQYSFAQGSEATMKQIQLLLNEKNSRTPAQRKIDSRLLQAVREYRGEKMAAGAELERANVGTDINGILKVPESCSRQYGKSQAH